MIGFLVSGPRHSGEAWLAARLGEHPGVRFLPQAPAYEREAESSSIVESLLARVGKVGEEPATAAMTGDLDPRYGMLDRRQVEALLLRQPGLRVILVLRAPLERAWAAVVDALRIAQMEPSEASDLWIGDFMASAYQRSQNDTASILEAWTGALPEDRLQVLLYDAMVNSPAEILRQSARFLGLDDSRLPAVVSGPDRAGDLAAIAAIHRTRLDALLTRDLSRNVARMEEMLGMTLPHWHEPPDVG